MWRKGQNILSVPAGMLSAAVVSRVMSTSFDVPSWKVKRNVGNWCRSVLGQRVLSTCVLSEHESVSAMWDCTDLSLGHDSISPAGNLHAACLGINQTMRLNYRRGTARRRAMSVDILSTAAQLYTREISHFMRRAAGGWPWKSVKVIALTDRTWLPISGL